MTPPSGETPSKEASALWTRVQLISLGASCDCPSSTSIRLPYNVFIINHSSPAQSPFIRSLDYTRQLTHTLKHHATQNNVDQDY